MQPLAIVLNMYYTGLGIARSLGEHRVPVLGLSSERRVYGNLTRYAQVRISPNSRTHPEELFRYLLHLGEAHSETKMIVFPTRDDDIIFLDRYREELERRFVLAIPSRPAMRACLDKWETHQQSAAAGIPVPKTWLIDGAKDLPGVVKELRYPCVLKPVATCDWRRGQNWALVGGRKAIGITSEEEFLREFQLVSRAETRVLAQELVQGDDSQLFVVGCFCDGASEMSTRFTGRKLVQLPEGFGTGCIVQAAVCPEVLSLAQRLLRAIQFTGIAELEFKRDCHSGRYKLIEINARAWDQHRLGHSCGADVIYAAYRFYAGLPAAASSASRSTEIERYAERKWIAEDAFLMGVLRGLWKNDGSVLRLLRAARGKRVFAIWSASDPGPSLLWTVTFGGALAATVAARLSKWFGGAWRRLLRAKLEHPLEAKRYELENSKSKP